MTQRAVKPNDKNEIEVAKKLAHIAEEHAVLKREFWYECRRGSACNHARIAEIRDRLKHLGEERTAVFNSRSMHS